ncbi:MAG: alpha/beta hydrolase-fold protein [Thermoanaerobaculia bacterium]|nr:alpha/beta hydrolase-fold protein [Thermoanaerobaculia bacterium]
MPQGPKPDRNYLLYLPQTYEETEEHWPLVLFLHGLEESGDDFELLKKHGPPKQADQGKQFPFILVSPQARVDEGWDVDALGELLDEVEKRYRVDATRRYVTGLSMGGHGTWTLARRYPDRFAALAPICGWAPADTAQHLSHVPVWIFHGLTDTVVDPSESKSIARSLNSTGAPVELTLYPETGHVGAWEKAYHGDALWDWMLSHSLASSLQGD